MVIQRLVEQIKQVVGAHQKLPVELHEPSFQGKEWDYVKACLDSGWVSSAGSYVTELENKLASYTGVRSAICTSNGTAALHAALVVAAVKQDEEILVPALTFVATINAILYAGAVPHFVDINEHSLCVCPEKTRRYLNEICEKKSDGTYNAKTGRKIKALMVMHTFGHPAQLDELKDVCDQFGIFLIEDAAEALGTFYKNNHVGRKGLLSVLSFNGNKIITTGGGGAILTDDPALAKRAKHITTTAKIAHAWEFIHDEMGYNYRLPNLNAALGCAQLEKLEYYKKCKRALAQKYLDAFKDLSGVKIFKEEPFANSNYWLNTILLDKADLSLRNEIIEKCHEEKIKVRPAWTLMNHLPFCKKFPSMDLSVSEDLYARIINLPSSVVLGEQYV